MTLQLRTFLLTVLLAAFLAAGAQHRFEVGVEGGPLFTQYTLIDPGNKLATTSCVSGYGGINFRFNTKDNYFLEVGLLATEHWAGFKIRNGSTLKKNSDAVLLLPVRFGYEVELTKNISLVPVAGFSPVIKTLSQDGSTGSLNTPDITLSHTAREMNKDFYLLLLAGAAVEVTTGSNIKLGFGSTYYRGLTRIVIWDIQYQKSGDQTRTANLISKGGFTSGQVSVKYLLK
jgi:hypothetical protein